MGEMRDTTRFRQIFVIKQHKAVKGLTRFLTNKNCEKGKRKKRKKMPNEFLWTVSNSLGSGK